MILKGKKVIIFGALDNQSIAWKVAEQCAKEGAELVLCPCGLQNEGRLQH